ncbi:MAG: EAL domain-containing protein [Candidatus Eremiobacteraeota bacterium]|nr:EAL domain-containing protein [Candidatus Eremiobacteraeota bacterium]
MAERTRWAHRVPIILAIVLLLVGIALAVSQLLAYARFMEVGTAPAISSRERIAIDAFRRSQPLANAALDYRDAVILGDASARARARIAMQREMAGIKSLLLSPPARTLDAANSLSELDKGWVNAQRAPMGWKGLDAVSAPLNALFNLIQNLGDSSNFSYERSHVTQNLADIAFNDLPSSLMFPRRAMLMVRHVVGAPRIALALRIGFNDVATAVSGSYSLTQDHLARTAASLRSTLPYSDIPAVTHFVERAHAYIAAGAALSNALGNASMLPRIDPASARRLAALSLAAERSTDALYGATASMLAADLQSREANYTNAQRARFLTLLGVLFVLLGSLLLAWSITNGRAQRALDEAKGERERLASELARQEAERALHLSEAQFRAVFDGSTMGIAILDRHGKAIDANAVYRSVIDVQHHLLDGHEGEFAEVMSGSRDAFTVERRISGLSEEMWVDVTISGVSDASGEHPFAMCTFADKTTIKQQERRLNFQRLHDALTGLPNRQAFEEQLAVRFDRSRSEAGALFSVIFVDLEHFKDVNESLGHSGGDAVLRQISTRLRGSLNADDTVARLGSDEFAILVGTLGDVIHVESLARRLLENLSKPFLVEGRPVFLGASIGIAIGPENYERGDEVLRDAEIAMQYAKTVGRERFAVFDAEMQTAAAERVALAADLRFAVERREFRVLYQPVVDLRTGAIKGAEALLRWDHPTRGVISPMLFIPLAERGGFARSIGAFVLDTGCSQIAAWRRSGIDINNFTLHFNATPTELLEPGFERTLSAAIDEYALKPSNLAIEITENSMLDDTDLAMERIERVRERGFAVCIDDFGTGYSSMRYMQHFKIDAIKIDKGFVAGANGEIASEPIVHTLVRLSEAFGVRVVAEGVETERQREVLIAAGCIDAQGFLFAEPLTAVEFRERLVAQGENLSPMSATGT